MADTSIACASSTKSQSPTIAAGVAILPDGTKKPKGGDNTFSEIRTKARKAINAALSEKRGFIRTIYVVGPEIDICFLRKNKVSSDPDNIRYIPVPVNGLLDLNPRSAADMVERIAPILKSRGVTLVFPVTTVTEEKSVRSRFREHGIKQFGKILPCQELKGGVDLHELLEKEQLKPRIFDRLRRLKRRIKISPF